MKKVFQRPLASAIFLGVLTLCSAAQAQQEKRVGLDESGKYILIEKRFLKTLVYRLESEQWLKLENKRLREQIESFEKLASSMSEEIDAQKRMIVAREESASISQMRLKSSDTKITNMERKIEEYKTALQVSIELDEVRKKENTVLRRRLTGQRIITWAVSAAGGAIMMFLLR